MVTSASTSGAKLFIKSLYPGVGKEAGYDQRNAGEEYDGRGFLAEYYVLYLSHLTRLSFGTSYSYILRESVSTYNQRSVANIFPSPLNSS